ncbi:hypothetical protein N9Z13_08170 [Luminiphilus sp.]|nr:hypothetical protein [Luminiphilus sp.]
MKADDVLLELPSAFYKNGKVDAVFVEELLSKFEKSGNFTKLLVKTWSSTSIRNPTARIEFIAEKLESPAARARIYEFTSKRRSEYRLKWNPYRWTLTESPEGLLPDIRNEEDLFFIKQVEGLPSMVFFDTDKICDFFQLDRIVEQPPQVIALYLWSLAEAAIWRRFDKVLDLKNLPALCSSCEPQVLDFVQLVTQQILPPNPDSNRKTKSGNAATQNVSKDTSNYDLAPEVEGSEVEPAPALFLQPRLLEKLEKFALEFEEWRREFTVVTIAPDVQSEGARLTDLSNFFSLISNTETQFHRLDSAVFELRKSLLNGVVQLGTSVGVPFEPVFEFSEEDSLDDRLEVLETTITSLGKAETAVLSLKGFDPSLVSAVVEREPAQAAETINDCIDYLDHLQALVRDDAHYQMAKREFLVRCEESSRSDRWAPLTADEFLTSQVFAARITNDLALPTAKQKCFRNL